MWPTGGNSVVPCRSAGLNLTPGLASRRVFNHLFQVKQNYIYHDFNEFESARNGHACATSKLANPENVKVLIGSRVFLLFDTFPLVPVDFYFLLFSKKYTLNARCISQVWATFNDFFSTMIIHFMVLDFWLIERNLWFLVVVCAAPTPPHNHNEFCSA